jgi:hypothetical protein
MNLNIPDSLPKLLVLLGIIGIAVGVYMEKEITDTYYAKFEKFDEIQDAVTLKNYIIELDRQNLIKRSEQLSERYNTENPIFDGDSIMTFERTFTGDKVKVLLTDSLAGYWDNYIKKKANLEILRKRKELKLANIEVEEKILDSRREFYGIFLGVGILVFILGIGTWAIDSTSESIEIIPQNQKVYKYCQSCGHNFTAVRTYGTEKNKKTNHAFCKGCYKRGKFVEQALSKEDFIKRKKEEIKDFNWLTKKILLIRFNKIERWNKKSYF